MILLFRLVHDCEHLSWLAIVELCHEHRRPSHRSSSFAISLPARLLTRPNSHQRVSKPCVDRHSQVCANFSPYAHRTFAHWIPCSSPVERRTRVVITRSFASECWTCASRDNSCRLRSISAILDRQLCRFSRTRSAMRMLWHVHSSCAASTAERSRLETPRSPACP
jgi:hypothetical protein